MFATVGGQASASKVLKSKSLWKTCENWNWKNGNGTDDYGFSALPGGLRNNFGDFNGDGVRGYFWSTKQVNTNGAFYVDLFSDRVTATLYVYRKSYALSVRCVKGKV